jgi:hypothetical protein
VNKKGTIFSFVLLTIMLFVTGLIITNFLKSPIDETRISLSCSTPDDISDGTKLMCLLIDSTIIYWIVLIFSLLGGIALNKLL